MYSAGRLLTNCTDYKSHNEKLWIVAQSGLHILDNVVWLRFSYFLSTF